MTYLTPIPDVSIKGHAVLTDRDTIKIVSYTIQDIKEPVVDQHELELIEVDAGGDPIRFRKYIREKASVACLQIAGKNQPIQSRER